MLIYFFSHLEKSMIKLFCQNEFLFPQNNPINNWVLQEQLLPCGRHLENVSYSYFMSFKKVNNQQLLLIIMRFRSSRLKMFFKLGFLKYFAIFKGKNQCLQACNFIKKWLQHRHFPVNIAKSLRTIFFTEHLQWLSLAFWNC